VSEEPNLGLATTRELLEELRARGDVTAAFEHEDGGLRGAAHVLGYYTSFLRNSLPDALLDYRTVDSR
jgi:hypothetical protein